MAEAEGQVWSADAYAKNARFVSDSARTILDWLAPCEGERILDLGCGDGILAMEIASSGAAVVGVDAAEDFVRAAKEGGVDARLGNGEALSFDSEFDAVFSNAALHWMLDADAVVEGVWRALRPGGRFVAEFGGHGNVAAVVTAMRALAPQYGIDPALSSPWYFPSAHAYRARLERHGFAVSKCELVPRLMALPTGLRGWLATFRQPFFNAAGDARDALLAEVEALLAHTLRDEAGGWTADYVRLRCIATKEGGS